MTKYEKLGNYLSYCTPHFAIASTYQVTCMIYRDNIFPDFIDMKFYLKVIIPTLDSEPTSKPNSNQYSKPITYI